MPFSTKSIDGKPAASKNAVLREFSRLAGLAKGGNLYDLSKPDTLRIQVLRDEGTREEQVRRCVAQAEHEATETAKVHGWQNWLKIEREERKVTDRFAADALIR